MAGSFCAYAGMPRHRVGAFVCAVQGCCFVSVGVVKVVVPGKALGLPVPTKEIQCLFL